MATRTGDTCRALRPGRASPRRARGRAWGRGGGQSGAAARAGRGREVLPEQARREHRLVPPGDRGGEARATPRTPWPRPTRCSTLAYLENGEIEKATHSPRRWRSTRSWATSATRRSSSTTGPHRPRCVALGRVGALYGRGLAIADQIGDRSLGALDEVQPQRDPHRPGSIRRGRAPHPRGHPTVAGVRRRGRCRRGPARTRPAACSSRGHRRRCATARGRPRVPDSQTGKQGEVLRDRRADRRDAADRRPSGRGPRRHRWRRPPRGDDRRRIRPGADPRPPPRLGLPPERPRLRRGGTAVLRRAPSNWPVRGAKHSRRR